MRRLAFWVGDLLSGGRLWRSYKDVCRLNSGVEAAQRRRMLDDILSFAKSNTNFYSSVEGSGLCDFPVVNKATIRSAYDAFCVPKNAIPGRRGDSIITHYTSGSTGIPFHVYQDKAAHIRSIATLKYYNDKVGYHSCEPMMKISMREAPCQSGRMFTYDRRNNIWSANLVVLDASTLLALIDMINAKGIRFIRAYMTIIDDLTSFVVDNSLELTSRPTFISIGELLSEPLRHRVVDTMGLHIVSQYANEENGVLGQNEIDSPGDVVRLNLSNHIIELLKLDYDEPASQGEMGRVVVTDLTNHAMPMIRYDIGDLAIPLEFGRDGRPLVLRLMACRACDAIHRTDGSVGTLTIPVEIWSVNGLRQLQFEQTGVKTYVLHANTSCPEALTEKKIAPLVDILGADAEVSIDYMDCPPEVSAGKRKMVVQSCPEYKRTL